MLKLLKNIFYKIKQFFHILFFIYNFYNLNRFIGDKKKNIYYIEKLKNNTDVIGIFAIKLIQWSLNRLKTIYNKDEYNLISKNFNKYYENCSNHDFNFTKEIYFKDFNKNILEDFEINEKPVASGSIGQVYEAYFIDNNNNRKKVAIKVLHPNIKNQIYLPKKMLLFFDYLTRKINSLKKFKAIININSFFENLKKQINLKIEVKNMKKMYELYKNNSFIVIPTVYKYSENIIVMSYEEGKYYENLKISDYQKYKIITLLKLLWRDSIEINNFIHGDLHNGNWKVRKHPDIKNMYQIILLDFGLFIEFSDKDFISNLNYAIEKCDIEKMWFHLKKYHNFEDKDQKLKKKWIDSVKDNFESQDYLNSTNKIFNFFIDNDLKLKTDFFNLGVVASITTDHFTKYGEGNKVYSDSKEKNNLFFYALPPIITFCKTYNCFMEYCKKIEVYFENSVSNYKMFEISEFDNIKIDSESELDTDSDSD